MRITETHVRDPAYIYARVRTKGRTKRKKKEPTEALSPPCVRVAPFSVGGDRSPFRERKIQHAKGSQNTHL